MQGRVFTWGFGGYGRLGHSEPRDEPIPRFLKTFDPSSNRAAKMINAGTSYSMAKTDHGEPNPADLVNSPLPSQYWV